jgi:hypothetical protein
MSGQRARYSFIAPDLFTGEANFTCEKLCCRVHMLANFREAFCLKEYHRQEKNVIYPYEGLDRPLFVHRTIPDHFAGATEVFDKRITCAGQFSPCRHEV